MTPEKLEYLRKLLSGEIKPDFTYARLLVDRRPFVVIHTTSRSTYVPSSEPDNRRYWAIDDKGKVTSND